MKKIKLYVGCALKNATKDFVQNVLNLRSELSKNPQFEVLEFLGPGEPKDIYQRDINECVAEADIMLAIVDVPSLGLGYEIATHCKHLKKPLLAVAQDDSLVSGLIIGIHGEGPFAFKRYKELSDVPKMLESWIKEDSFF